MSGMDPAREQVALLDAERRVTGSASRARVRAENLRHAATSIVVRNLAGEVFVHRRTPTKDVYPGLLDFAAGGVLGCGELPDDGARRELAEELGIGNVPLRPAGVAAYADAYTRYWAYRYTVHWDGPLRLQAEEISSGEWLAPEQLRERIQRSPRDFVPDSLALWPCWSSLG